MKAILHAGSGYWNCQRYPKCGDFRRAKEDMLIENVQVESVFTNGEPREFTATLPVSGDRISVKLECLSAFDEPLPLRATGMEVV